MEKDIIELLKNGEIYDFFEISEKLGLSKDMDEVLAMKLNEMVNKYVLTRTNKGRYMLFEKHEKNKNYYKGIFMDTNSDYGFVHTDSLDEDIFIHGTKTNGALNGDEVLVYVTKSAKEGKKHEGEIVKIIKREVKNKVGEIYHFKKKTMVSLDDKKFKKLIYLPESREVKRLVDGDKVVISFDGSKAEKEFIEAKFIKRIGHINDPGIDILSIIIDHGINMDFSEECLKELENLPTEVQKIDLVGMKDLRKEMIFTIDGDDTKDIDDAISAKKLKNGNYELGVHIAHVSFYIKENSALDLEARRRGTSTYLTDRVIPMFPHQISNGICSLNPNVDRLTISCIMEIDPKGKLVKYDIFPSVIKSRIQMTYNKVNEILEKNQTPEGYEEYRDTLLLMNELAHIIRDERNSRGAIDFDTDEAKILVDEEGNPTEITLRDRGEGERLIEDFMVRANETVASHFYFMDLPSIYRIHGEPAEERLIKFLNTLEPLGIRIKSNFHKMSPRVIQRMVNELKTHKEFKVLSTKLLSCMDKAIYSPENIGHFALASKIYTHFTSPIRRYPDLTIHRLLDNYFFSEDGITEKKKAHFAEILSSIAEISSEMERNSEDCERDVEDMKMVEYMERFMDKEFHGMVSGIASFGVFVQLDNLIEGLIPMETLGDNYNYDSKLETLKVNNHFFRLGTEVIVKVIRVSKEESEIDFEFVKRCDHKNEKNKEKN